jgi:hypothetical protein
MYALEEMLLQCMVHIDHLLATLITYLHGTCGTPWRLAPWPPSRAEARGSCGIGETPLVVRRDAHRERRLASHVIN